MKLWMTRLALGSALIALGVWSWQVFYPSPEHAIRNRLSELARAATISPNESALIKLAKAQKLASFFTVDTEIRLDLPGRFPQSLNGRDELMQVVAGARSSVKSLKVEFVDVTVTVGSDTVSGSAHFTVKADVSGESTPQVEELEAQFRKVDGDWLIKHVENVQTLH